MAAADKESRKSNQSLREFQGVNTRNSRTVIGDNQFAWLENVIPIGHGNITATPGPSASLALWPTTVYNIQNVNLNGVDYMFGFGTNGAGYTINLSSFAVATFAVAATFSGAGTVLAQWQNTQIIIVDPTKGYFSWNGTTLQNWVGTLQSLTITNIGTGYTTQPTVTFSSGSAAATCDIQVGLATLAAAGTGYVVGDILTVAGGTRATSAQIKVATVSGGAITGINLLTTGDYTVAPANPASVTGGYGTGATFTLNFGIGPVTLTNIGSGYGGGAPIVTVSGGGGTGGTITANISAVPSGGTAVATFAGRVWVSSNRTIAFSAPNSFNDFSSATAGGSFIVSDETLHSSITGLLTANNYLYIFGTSSINLLSDVSVVNGATVFSNTNINANIGSTFPYSLSSYYRGIWFSTNYGFYALYGSTAQKASDEIDGTYGLINTLQPISSGTALIGKILVQCFLFQYRDPVLGQRPLIACFFDKKWFFSSQGNSLTLIAGAVVSGNPQLFGTDGLNLYQLFSNTTSNINQTIITKLWDMNHPILDKQSFKLGIEMTLLTTVNPITGTVDTENPQNSYPWTLQGGNVITWINNTNQTVQWQNNSLQPVMWLSNGYSFNATNVSTAGKYLGVTINATSPGALYSGVHLQYEERSAWT